MQTRFETFRNWCTSLPEERKIQAATAVLIVLMAITLNAAAGFLLLLILFWKDRSHLKAMYLGLLQRSNWLMIVAPIAIFFVCMSLNRPAALDDLLRNIVIWQWDYDYRKAFPDADLYSWSMWYGFDRALGFIGHYLEPQYVMWLVEGIAASAMLAVLYVAGAQCLERTEDRIFWIAALTWLAFRITLPRIVLGRPEIFMAIWAAAALLPRRSVGVALWTICGLALSSAYWLAFLYFPAVVLLKTSVRVRVSIGVVLVAFHCAFWHWVSGGEYFGSLLWLKRSMDNEIGETVSIGENNTILRAVTEPWFWFLFAAAVYGAFTASRKPWLLIGIVAYFFLSDQIRYLATIALLLAVFIWTTWADRLPPLGTAGRSVLFVVMFVALYSCLPGFTYDGLRQLPGFKLPHGSKVITAFGMSTYGVVFHNPGTVQVAPAFAFGASPQDIQHLSAGIYNGSVDCVIIKRWAYTHVVENTLAGKKPICLDLIEVQQGWRLWEVRK